jgi:hypothetical protein
MTVILVLALGIILDYLVKLEGVSFSAAGWLASLYFFLNNRTRSIDIAVLTIAYSCLYGILLQQNLAIFIIPSAIALLLNELLRGMGWAFLILSLGFFNVWALLLGIEGTRFTVVEVLVTVISNVICSALIVLIVNTTNFRGKKTYA